MKKPKLQVVPSDKTPTAKEAAEIMRRLAEAGAVSWTKHSKERMAERKITVQQIMHCLKKGNVTENPFYTPKNGGGYEVAIERMVAGEWLRVAVCLKISQTALIITAYKVY